MNNFNSSIQLLGSIAPISSAQRKCLSHLLRNVMESLSATLALIENETADLSTNDLSLCISNPVKLLQRMESAFCNSSFCVISSKECAWIGKYCGCEGIPKTNKLSLSTDTDET